jgi:hypothetical protein
MNSTPTTRPDLSTAESNSSESRAVLGPGRGGDAPAPLDQPARRRLAYFTASCAALLLASVIYAPFVANGPVLCPFRIMTGLPCPGCGLTRSFCAMSRGQLAAAFGDHLFGPVLYFVALLSIPLMIYQLITNRRIEWFHRLCYSRSLARIMAILFGGYHLVRISLLLQSGQVPHLIAHAPILRLLSV